MKRSWIEISRSRIAANYAAVRDAVGPNVEIACVVKADAYRHGAAEISRILAAHGARWFAVSSAEEGIALRQAGIAARILVMADMLPSDPGALHEFQLTPAIHSLDQLRELEELAQPIAYHLKLDTGMARLGTRASAEEIAAAVTSCQHARLEGLMTHLASAADYSRPQSQEQIAAFDAVCDGLRRHGINPPFQHAAGTIAIAYGRREAWRNMVRPGHAIYGYISPARGNAPPSLLHVVPALRWLASILAVKDLPAGAKIGYGAMFKAPAPMRIGILAAGYADGIPHSLSARGHVIAGGEFAPILGAVSMDLTSIDLTAAPHLKPGDAVTLIGEEGDCRQDAQQMAREAGTISYSLLCSISARVHRVYVE
ncbi:MAG: alanine racemase [Acidimicrobiia bacterium]|nr:alanine racemase [Acidimicrobiia bacterium]